MRFKAVLFFCLLPLMLHARPGFYPPWGKDADLRHTYPEAPQQPATLSLGVRLASQVIRFHQQVLSPVDGPRSHFRPSSSGYMLQAMQKHGFIEGFLLGCDRLLRENNSTWVYRTIESEGKIYKYDPVP